MSAIILKTAELFLKYGIKSISMDEIAKSLGMSKKTLYQYVDNKEDLVNKIMLKFLEEDKVVIEEIRSASENAIDGMVKTFKYVCQKRRIISQSVLFDLQKYYPSSWALVHDFTQNYLLDRILANLEEGKQQGLYRPDVRAEIIAKIYLAGLDASLDTDLFPTDEFHFLEVYSEYIRYHLHGISSEKGVKYLDQLNPEYLYA